MNIPDYNIHYIELSFEEANILIENIQNHNLSDLIVRLDNIIENTSDIYLRMILKSVLNKIQTLTPAEYTILKTDIENNAILFPPHYTLPYVDQFEENK